MTLQAQREGTEKRISVARRDYIQAVQVYNTELRTFPCRIWAAILYSDMAPRETFTQPESVAAPPQVNFIYGCWRAATVRPLDRGGPAAGPRQFGSASCRESFLQSVYFSFVPVLFNKNFISYP